METDISYAVFVSQIETAIGYFLNGKYYEPFGSERQLGHLDADNNFVYYMVTPENPEPRILGQVIGHTLVRNRDGVVFQIQPVQLDA